MKVLEKSLKDIKPYERNPRNNDAAVDYVAKSIESFGFKVPIVIDAGGVIVAGHTRYKAAEKLGLETIPCIVADDLSPEQVKAFRLADNKVAEFGGWDFSMLVEELDSLKELDLGFSMEDFGFQESAVNDIGGMFTESESGGEKEPKMTICPFCGKEHEV